MTAWPFDPLNPFSATVIVADPPWKYELRSERGEAKSAQAHYECMPTPEIKALPVNQLAASNCWLFLRVTAPMLPAGLDVMTAWGFEYVTRAAWRKTTTGGKVRVGTGYIVRTMHEDVLIGRIGRPPYAKPLPSLFDGLARKHSRKPLLAPCGSFWGIWWSQRGYSGSVVAQGPWLESTFVEACRAADRAFRTSQPFGGVDD